MLELGGRHSTSPGASHIRPHPTGVCRIDEQVGAAKLTLDMVGESANALVVAHIEWVSLDVESARLQRSTKN